MAPHLYLMGSPSMGQPRTTQRHAWKPQMHVHPLSTSATAHPCLGRACWVIIPRHPDVRQSQPWPDILQTIGSSSHSALPDRFRGVRSIIAKIGNDYAARLHRLGHQQTCVLLSRFRCRLKRRMLGSRKKICGSIGFHWTVA